MKAYTDLEQSKKLIELGIDVNTADIIYNILDVSYIRHDTPIDKYHTPAWSLTALMEVLPSYIGDYSKTLYYDKGEWYCTYSDDCAYSDDGEFMITIGETHADSAVDAVVEMIVKLKEKDLL